MRLKNFVIVSLLFGLTNTALANEATLINESKSNQPMTVVYKVAHKNSKQEIILGPAISVTFSNQTTVPFELGDNELAGLVTVSINGHRIPETVTQFAKPAMCSLATDKTHTSGSLVFSAEEYFPKGGKISCYAKGGIYN